MSSFGFSGWYRVVYVFVWKDHVDQNCMLRTKKMNVGMYLLCCIHKEMYTENTDIQACAVVRIHCFKVVSDLACACAFFIASTQVLQCFYVVCPKPYTLNPKP